MRKVEVEKSYSEEVAADLAKTLFGQDEACEAVARMIVRFETGLTLPNKPAGVVMFLGPTGVGKTEMARALSRHLFGSPDSDRLKVINCAEFSEPHTISRFLGAPPSYVGYGDELLIEPDFLAKRNIIVFDEIEKADPALWKMLLSVFSAGSVTAKCDAGGKKGVREVSLNFGYSFIILTSNVGAWEIQNTGRKLGFGNGGGNTDVGRAAMTGLTECFGRLPEFLGRIDEKIVFKQLSDEHYEQIYWKFIAELNDNLRSKILFTTSDSLTSYLIALAVKNKEFGARDMEHTIKTVLLQPLSDVLAMEPKTDLLVGDLDDYGEIVFYMR